MSGFHLAAAQQFTVRGTLQTKSGKAVAYASVMVNDATTNKVIAFQSSDENGAFMLQLAPALAGHDLVLEVNHLGYRRVRQPLKRGNNTYNILLEEQAIPLAEVEVKSRPVISSRGDTLSYDVGSFAKNEDRSIEDVIKRMPGIEISKNGQIKFNGKNISNLYIDGDDLLDDKYAIGTKTIPYAMVKGIEVLQNHQPLKVLKNKVFSDQIALNLVIKEEAKLKLTAQAKLGAGLPKQYDGELNAMLFNKHYKMLNLVKGNNVGDDLRSDFEGFNRSAFLERMGNSRPRVLLSPGIVGTPALPKKSYYFNHSGAINANNLINYSNGLQLKSTVQLLLDKNQMSYHNQTEFYSASDTIRYSEHQQIDKHPFLANASLNARLNKDTYFLNNSLSFAYSDESGNASLVNNGTEISQQLKYKVRDFANHFQYMPELKNKNIIDINWYLNHVNQPQSLLIQPGINAATFNTGKPFKSLDQIAETPTWFTRATVGYRLTRGAIKQRYQAGILHESQALLSQLTLHQLDGTQTPYSASPGNKLHWNRQQFFVGGTYEYKKNKLESRLSMPIILQHIAYKDQGFTLDESTSRFFLNPDLQIRYRVNVEDDMSFNYTFKNETGNINDVFRGAVLSNYRNLRANDALLQEQESHTIGLGYRFKRAIKLLFMNAGASYTLAKASTIASAIVSNNISQTIRLPLVNEINSFRINGGISKYIFGLGATANLNASWSITRFNQLFNEALLPFNNIVFTLHPEVEVRLFDHIAFNYSGTASWLSSKQAAEAAAHYPFGRRIQTFDQVLALSYSPAKNTFIKIKGRYQFSKRPANRDVHYLFSDVYAGYKIKRWRTDIELDISNLANIQAYETYGISSNRFEYNRYQLRGRMVMLRTVFNL